MRLPNFLAKELFASITKATTPEFHATETGLGRYLVYNLSDITLVLLKKDRVSFYALNFEMLGTEYVVMEDYEIYMVDPDGKTYAVDDAGIERMITGWISWRSEAISKFKI